MKRQRKPKTNVNDVARFHQLKIARATMNMTCEGALILGGMNHVEAAKLLNVKIPQGCTCKGAQ